jgi:hypothetical protein
MRLPSTVHHRHASTSALLFYASQRISRKRNTEAKINYSSAPSLRPRTQKNQKLHQILDNKKPAWFLNQAGFLSFSKVNKINVTKRLGDNLLSLILTTKYHRRYVRFTCEFEM